MVKRKHHQPPSPDPDDDDEDEELNSKDMYTIVPEPSRPILPPIFTQNSNRELSFRRLRRASTNVEKFGPMGAITIENRQNCHTYPIGLTYLILVVAMSIACTAIGSVYLNECSGQPNLPIILLTFGVTQFVTAVCDIIALTQFFSNTASGDSDDEDDDVIRNQRREDDEFENGDKRSCLKGFRFSSFLRLVSFGLFIYLCVLVFNIYSPSPYTKEAKTKPDRPYCDKVVYLFSFWYLIISFVEAGILLLVLITCCCCFWCCVCFLNFFGKNIPNADESNREIAPIITRTRRRRKERNVDYEDSNKGPSSSPVSESTSSGSPY